MYHQRTYLWSQEGKTTSSIFMMTADPATPTTTTHMTRKKMGRDSAQNCLSLSLRSSTHRHKACGAEGVLGHVGEMRGTDEASGVCAARQLTLYEDRDSDRSGVSGNSLSGRRPSSAVVSSSFQGAGSMRRGVSGSLPGAATSSWVVSACLRG